MKLYNKTNYFLKILSAIAAVFFITSCEDIVDESPISEISPDNFFRNNSEALSGVIGMYDGMQPTFRTKHYFWGEFRGE